MSGKEGVLAGCIQSFMKPLSSPTFYLILTDAPGAGPFWDPHLRDQESEAQPARGAQAWSH